jgi:predicted peptidase
MKHRTLLALLTIMLAACSANTAPTAVPTVTYGSSAATLSPADLTFRPPANCDKAGANTIEFGCASPATGLHYLLALPQTRDGKPPLLIYLHGFSHSGSNLEVVLTGGVPAEIEKGRQLPMIVVSPQCPAGENWQYGDMVPRLNRFVNEMIATYGADPDRTYLTGFSMGGDGVWTVGAAYPAQFAALAPIGSWYSDDKAVCALRDVPVWDFQGESDEFVSPDFARNMTAALQKCGGRVKLTLYPETGHEQSSRNAYATDALYSWLLAQKRMTHGG